MILVKELIRLYCILNAVENKTYIKNNALTEKNVASKYITYVLKCVGSRLPKQQKIRMHSQVRFQT